MRSEVAALELLSAHEVLQVAPEVVARGHVVVPLVPLQLQSLDIPAIDDGGDLRVRIVDVVAADSGE